MAANIQHSCMLYRVFTERSIISAVADAADNLMWESHVRLYIYVYSIEWIRLKSWRELIMISLHVLTSQDSKSPHEWKLWAVMRWLWELNLFQDSKAWNRVIVLFHNILHKGNSFLRSASRVQGTVFIYYVRNRQRVNIVLISKTQFARQARRIKHNFTFLFRGIAPSDTVKLPVIVKIYSISLSSRHWKSRTGASERTH